MLKIPFDFKENPKKVAMVAGAIVLVCVYFYLKLFVMPQVQGIAKLLAKSNKMKTEVKSAEADIAKIQKLDKEITLYKSKIESYERMLPVEQEVPKLLEDLSAMAKNSNVKIVGITPLVSKQETSPDMIYQEIPILINARSGYHELGRFLADLEGSDRFMKVADLNIKENGSNLKRHDVELLVLTYILLEHK